MIPQKFKNNAIWKLAVKIRYYKPDIPNWRRIKHSVKTNHRTLSLLKWYYYSPKKQYSDIKLSERAQIWFKEFQENGILRIDNEFLKEAQYLNDEIFNKIPSDKLSERDIAGGRVYLKELSFKNPQLFRLFFHEDLMAMLNKHYQTQAYYRNLSAVINTSYNAQNNTEDIQGLFHLDGGLDQISIMLLVNDITENDTHMEFCLKSTHTKHKDISRFNKDQKEITNRYEITHCVGKAGTLYIFQAGIGYHRAVYKSGSVRKMYHANFTAGHDIVPQKMDDLKHFAELKEKPFYIKKMLDKLI